MPDVPGVYFFLGPRRKILYIGRATSLRDRVRSYFLRGVSEARGPLIERMLKDARSVSWQKTDSVLEAIILEANLIKKHRPPFNTREKDDKSFQYVVITKEEFPRVLVVRGRELHEEFPPGSALDVFGPFPHGSLFREAMRLIRKIFPFRDACVPGAGKLCFNRQIGMCPGVCSGEISARDYAKRIRHLAFFLSGRKQTLVRALERSMRALSKQKKFEQAADVKRRIFALSHIRDVSLIKDEFRAIKGGGRCFRIESYDVAHTSGSGTVGVMVVMENGELVKDEYRKFRVRADTRGSDTGALAEIIERRIGHSEWPLPSLFVLDGGNTQRNTVLRILNRYGYAIPVVNVVKDERHAPKRIVGNRATIREREREILLVNAEAHRFAVRYHDALRRKNFI